MAFDTTVVTWEVEERAIRALHGLAIRVRLLTTSFTWSKVTAVAVVIVVGAVIIAAVVVVATVGVVSVISVTVVVVTSSKPLPLGECGVVCRGRDRCWGDSSVEPFCCLICGLKTYQSVKLTL